MTTRRFPPPWRVIEHAEPFWVQDAKGQTVVWFYFRNNPLVAKTAGVLLKEEARRMAVNFAKLPELLAKRTATPESSVIRTASAASRR